MVVAWEFPISVWATEFGSSWVINLDSNFLGGCVELHVGNLPWSARAKDVLVEFFVLLLGFLSRKILPLPAQNPYGPEFRLKFHCVKVIPVSHPSMFRFKEAHGSSYHRQLSWRSMLAKKLESVSGLVGSWLVRDAHSGHGFLTSGSKDERLRFTRLYLDSQDVKTSFSPKLSLDQTTFLLEMRQKYGLVILDGLRVPKMLDEMVLRIPKFVSLIIDVPTKDEDLLRTLPPDRRNSFKYANSSDVEVKVTRSMDFVSEFFERYHGPTIHRSHGDEGHVLSLRHLRKMLQCPDNEFMQIFKGGECLTVELCLKQRSTFRMYTTGWLHGSKEQLKGGIQSVRIWKALTRARELGCNLLDLGGTPPFLDDGVFNFKMRWNARLNQARLTYGNHYLLIDPAHPSIQSFFANHPTIVYDRHNKLCILSANKPSEVQFRPSILEGISSWWRLVSPEEAQDRDLSKAPTEDMPSGWCVRETLP